MLLMGEPELLDRKLFENPQISSVFDSLMDGYSTFDDNWCLTFASPSCRRLFGLNDDHIGQNLWQQFPLLAKTRFQPQARQAVANKELISFEGRGPHTRRWLKSYLQPCQNGAIIFCRDINERVEARNELLRFVAILEATTDFVCIADSQGKPTYLNQAGRRLIGLHENEDVSNVQLHPKWATDLILTEGLPTALRDGAWASETALLTRDEREIPVSQVTIAHKGSGGEIEFISTIARDITERKLAENQLREHAALLDHAPDAILVSDINHKIVYWNKSATKIYGWSEQEVMGRDFCELLHTPATAKNFPTAINHLIENGEWRGEARHHIKDGKEIIADCYWTVVHDPGGQVKSFLIINTDITERKMLEEQFLRAQRLESIGTLANGIAHDINNVLSPILLATRILSLKFTDDDSQQLLKTLRRSAERGADLVRQVMTYVRGADGERALLQPSQAIYEVTRILQETLPKSITLELSIPSRLWSVSGDITQLYQVLMNLCLNARDAMPRGGVLAISAENFTVTAESLKAHYEATAGPFVRINITDNGSGIPEDILTKIFEPFFTTKTHGQGSGLGLSTVLGIVKSHQGFIEVETRIEMGTSFKVFLPAAVNQPALKIKPDNQEFPRGTGQTVLIVDDEIEILAMTSEILAAYGYKTLMASSGDAAVQQFHQHSAHIDLVLIDMMMPRKDGLETIRELRKLSSQVKIITTSGLADNQKLAEATALGASAFLAKPCLPAKMIQTIAEVLQSQP